MSRAAAVSDPVAAYLRAQDKPTLVALILEHADEAFLACLELQAARCAPKGPDLRCFRDHLEEILDGMRGWGYRETAGHAENLERFAGTLQDLIADGHPAAAMELAAAAMEGVEARYGDVDDSYGCVGGAARMLRQVHRLACGLAGPDPEALAQWLFRMEMRSDYGLFDGLLPDYRTILSERGLACYRRLAEEVWDHIPPLKPMEEQSGSVGRWRITSIMKALVEDDPEAGLDVLLQDLSTSSRFLEVANHCLAAGWSDRAIQWAEEGLRAFEKPDSRLRAFLADRYLGTEQTLEAVELRWANFQERPDLDSYQAFLAAARKETEAYAQRERALGHLRERFAAAQAGQNRWSRSDLDLLVHIHLYEMAPLEALKAAREGGCQHGTWMTLTECLERSQPEEALRILQEQLDAIVAPTGDEAYRRATGALLRIRDLAARTKRPGAFNATLAQVMATHGRKRNLLARIKKAGLM